MSKRYTYRDKVERMATSYYGREPQTREEWITVVARAMEYGKQLAYKKCRARVEDAEGRMNNALKLKGFAVSERAPHD